VRHPEHPDFLEERWLFEALTESYLPLLMVLDGLLRDRVEFRLAMSITPPLTAMLDDGLLRERYRTYLDRLIDLAEKETLRQSQDPRFRDVACFYLERFRAVAAFWEERIGRDVVGAFRSVADTGRLELLASAATHAVLPAIRLDPSSVRAQVAVGIESHRRSFGRSPAGFWLPECAYFPGLDEVLAAEGIRYFILETHGVLRGSSRARYGVNAPILCPSGVAAFGRDPDSSKQVWSAEEGYPGDPEYRDFYRDIGFDLPLDLLGSSAGSSIGPDDLRIATGIKYHRVTARRSVRKEPYVRARALERAAEHARHFVESRRERIESLAGSMDRRPILVAPYDAELFGHWWFEGPEWLDGVLRRLAADPSVLAATMPSRYLEEYPAAQLSVPSLSSWGEGGFLETWVNESTEWIYPRLLGAAARMEDLTFRRRGADGLERRALAQAARELLLAQASDWPFILRNRTVLGYARRRLEEHLSRFEALAAWADAGVLEPDEERLLAEWEGQDAIFPWVSPDVFAPGDRRESWARPREPRRAAFIAAECVPFVKVGGLADVAGSLPAALAEAGVEVTVVLPGYGAIDRARHGIRPLLEDLPASLGGRTERFGISEASPPAPGVRAILIDHPGFFGRPGIYGDPKTGEEFPDASERFIFFARAALEALRVLGAPLDIVHCNDHHTALAAAHLRRTFKGDAVLGRAASILTIHNLGYQGLCQPDAFALSGLDAAPLRPGSPFEHKGELNILKAGIIFADKVSTVSEAYAREICEDPVAGAGLEEILQMRRPDLVGILNGIDVREWDPETDPRLPARYSRDDLSGKGECKRALREKVGLDPGRGDAPLLGMITRLMDQKGIDLVCDGLERILGMGADLVILGTGLPKYHEYLRAAEAMHKGRLSVLLKFDEAMAHLIEAGADAFLMPSLYEPCGLNQMYSLRYGTVPVVRSTGGLADTVADDDAHPGAGNGFSFVEYETEALLDVVGRALAAYRDPGRWRRIILAGMAADNSWTVSAGRYLDLYRDALERVG
jgi:1,4-alpha-glucan branching enzyme